MLGDLALVLERYPAAVRPQTPPRDLGNAGGMSGARFWSYTAGRSPFLMRAWPPDGPPREVLERIHAWLDDAKDVGFLPLPVPTLDGRTLTEQSGRLWELDPYLPGSPHLHRPPERPLVRTAFAALAAFHARLAVHESIRPSPGAQIRLAELSALMGGGFDVLARAVRDAPADDRSQLAARWLTLAPGCVPPLRERLERAVVEPVAVQPCLRDARPEHFLFDGDRLSGLVDFGAMGIDTVSVDLARLSAEWLGDDPGPRREALGAYSAIRPLSPVEVERIEMFEDVSALLIGGHWTRWHFVEGRRFEDPGVVARGLEKGLERLVARLRPAGTFRAPR